MSTWVWSVGFFLFLLLSFWTFSGNARFSPYQFLKPRTQHNVAIVMVCNRGFDCPESKPEDINKAFFQSMHGVKNFIETASGHQHKIIGQVTNWIRPSFNLASAEELIKRRNDILELAQKEIPLSAFDIFYIYTQLPQQGHQIGWSPQNNSIETSEEQQKAGLIFMSNANTFIEPKSGHTNSKVVPSTSWAHELLHALGLNGHAQGLQCTKLDSLKGCQLKASGDPFSIMGDGRLSLYPNAAMKEILFWNHPGDILEVNEDGLFRITSAHATNGVKALKINLPFPLKLNNKVSVNSVYVEYKTPHSFDNAIPDGGALVYFAQNPNASETVLIDTHPQTANVKASGSRWPEKAGEMADALLSPGESLNLFNLFTLKIKDAGSSFMSVEISGLPR